MTRSGSPQAPRRTARRWLIAAALVAALAALAWFWRPLSAQAQAGAAYGARIGCSCHFVAGRPFDQCRDDFMPGMSLVMLSADAEEKSVTARVFPIASETARFRKGQGCLFTPKN
jgi:hypothetical protein